MLGSEKLSAQATRPSISKDGNSNDSSDAQIETPKEKAYVNYYQMEDLNQKFEFKDTTLNNFEIYAPHRSMQNGALILGNLGSSAQAILYKERNSLFTDMGFHQYDIYSLEKQKFKFYELNRAHNDLYFSPLSGQQDFMVHAKFSRNLADNINLSIDFERIKQEGFYKNQETKLTRFGIGLSKKSDNHQLYALFIANNFNELHNGGATLDIDSAYVDPIFRTDRTAIATFTDDANSRHQYFSYSIDNFWKLKMSSVQLHQSTRLEQGYFRFSDDDTDSPEDSTLYKSYLTKDRGIRAVNRFSRWSNTLDFALKFRSLKLILGLDYRYLKFQNSLNTNNIHDLGLFADIKFVHNKLGDIHSRAEIGVGENIGNFLIAADLKLNLTKSILLYADFATNRYDASLNQKQFVVTEQMVFNNDFNKITEANIEAGLKFKKLNLNLSAKSGIIDNAIAYNNEALPYQSNASIEYIQFNIKHNFFWRFFGFENEFNYQSFSNNVYRLPTIYSRHNLFLQTRLFKRRLLSRLGIQYYNIQNDGSLAFMPVNGAFYPGSKDLDYNPITEVYAIFQVEKFRIFFRIDNFADMLKPKVYYQIVNHPQFDSNFRMGVRWILSD